MTSFALKILAIITMTIDHIGYSYSIFPFRLIGRIAFPIFAFQIAIGFSKTSNKEKYIGRMILFTIISQLPYILFSQTVPSVPFDLNVGATFTIALIALYLIEKLDNKFLKVLSTLAILFITHNFIPCDYGAYGVVMVILFYLFKNNMPLLATMFFMLATARIFEIQRTYYLGTYLALVPILLYNGQKGKPMKYFFYAYYPLHMLAIWAVHTYL